MKDELERIARDCSHVQLRVFYSDPLPSDKQGRDCLFGERLSVPLLRDELRTNNYDFYICGPPPMMTSIVTGLTEWGVPTIHIHKEAFGSASVKKERPKESFAVVFSRSEKRAAWKGDEGSLLEFAESKEISGIDSSGCHAGSCGTCKVAIQSGKVSYNQPPDFAVEEGSCLPCICVPASDLELDA